MKYIKEFKYQQNYEKINESESYLINESIFSFLGNIFNKIKKWFNDPKNIENKLYKVISNNDDIKLFQNKDIKNGETIFILLKNNSKDNENIILCATKINDIDDKSAIYSLMACNNKDVIKSFTNEEDIDSLTKNDVMIIINDIIKDKPLEIKILKNIMKGGTQYKSQFLVSGVAKDSQLKLDETQSE